MVIYLHLADYHPARNTKADKNFAKKLHYKNIKFPGKIKDIQKIRKKNSIAIGVHGYEKKKNIQFMYQRNVAKKIILIFH